MAEDDEAETKQKSPAPAPMNGAALFAELKKILPDVKEEDYKKMGVWQEDIIRLDAELLRRHIRNVGGEDIETNLPKYVPPPREKWSTLGKAPAVRPPVFVGSLPGSNGAALQAAKAAGFQPKQDASAQDADGADGAESRGVKRPLGDANEPDAKRPQLGVNPVARPQAPIVVGAANLNVVRAADRVAPGVRPGTPRPQAFLARPIVVGGASGLNVLGVRPQAPIVVGAGGKNVLAGPRPLVARPSPGPRPIVVGSANLGAAHRVAQSGVRPMGLVRPIFRPMK